MKEFIEYKNYVEDYIKKRSDILERTKSSEFFPMRRRKQLIETEMYIHLSTILNQFNEYYSFSHSDYCELKLFAKDSVMIFVYCD